MSCCVGLHRAAPRTGSRPSPNAIRIILYEGLLTLLMRLVFLLYAEDRDLLPSSTDGAPETALGEWLFRSKTLYARLLVDEALKSRYDG